MDKSYLENIRKIIDIVDKWPQLTQLHTNDNKMFKYYNTNIKDTRFSKWYYGEAQVFSSFKSFNKLESLFQDAFESYIEYLHLYNKKKPLFFNKSKHEEMLQDLFVNFIDKVNDLKIHLMDFYGEIYSSPLFMGLTDKIVNTEQQTGTGDMIRKKESEEYLPKESTKPEKTGTSSSIELDKGSESSSGDDFDIDDEIKRILS